MNKLNQIMLQRIYSIILNNNKRIQSEHSKQCKTINSNKDHNHLSNNLGLIYKQFHNNKSLYLIIILQLNKSKSQKQ